MYAIRNLIIVYSVTIGVTLLIVFNVFSTLRLQEKELAAIMVARETLQRLQPAIMNLQDLETATLDTQKNKASRITKLMELIRQDSVLLQNLVTTQPENKAIFRQLASLQQMAISNRLQPDSLENLVDRFKITAGKLEDESRKILSSGYNNSVNLTKRTVIFVTIISAVLIFFLVYGFYFTYRDITNKYRYSEQLKLFNQELEEQVARQTRAIKKNEERYRALVDNAPEALVVFDVHEKKFVSVSESAVKLFKMSREELLQTGPVEISPACQPDGRPSDEAAMEKIRLAIQGEKPSFEWTHMNKEGELIPCEVWLVKLPAENQLLIRGSIIDISERKKAEAAIRESEAKYRAFFENSMDGILLTIPDGRILAANPAACQILRMTEEEICRAGRQGLVDASDPTVEQYLKQRQLTGKAAGEMTFVRKDGTRFVAELTTSVFRNAQGEERTIIVFRDIAERKKMEQELREAESKFRSLAEKSLVGIYIIQDGMYAYVNPRFAEIFGYSQKELMDGMPAETVIATQKRSIATENIRARIAGEIESVHYEVEGLKKNGDLLQVEIFGSRILYNGRPAIVGSLLDITERKRAEQELLESYRQIRQLSDHLQNIREEERTHIAREIHDELGQYLTVLKMEASWINNHFDKPAAEIRRKLQDLMALLDETVRTVRRISSELRPSLLDDLGLISAIEWHSREFEKRTGIKTHFSASCGDLTLTNNVKTGLFRIYQESLTNVARHAKAKNVMITAELDAANLVLRITDDGKGFQPEILKEKQTLGILGMKERSAMMQGFYEIKSMPGNGTIVTVTVPLS